MENPIFCSNPKAQFITQKQEITESIHRVLDSDTYILGTEVSNFEKEFAAYIGVTNCISVNSGTDSIILSLRALGISYGDEVITPSHTAIATVAAIRSTGATPIFADINIFSYTLDPNSILEAITYKTKAIIAVHLYGNSCDMDLISQISKDNDIYLIEDCSQSHGAKWRDRKLGTFGILACFSFYPTKNLGAIGDGGAVVTNENELAETIRMLRQYGWDKEKVSRLSSTVSRLDELQAAVLRVKLLSLDSGNDKRRKNALKYSELLKDSNLTLPTVSPNAEHVYHLFVIQSPNREQVIKEMNYHQIFPGIHYPKPVHLQPAYNHGNNSPTCKLTNTEKIMNSILSLPMYPELSELEIERVCEVITKFDSTNY
jgi:dTDP-4-amino-4,6-dideoxygalactose transaminase